MYIKLLKGVLTSYAFSLIAFFVFALVLSFTNVSDASIPGIVLLISLLSILIGSSNCSKKAETQGWMWGGAVGGTYAIILYSISSIVTTNFKMPLATFYLFLGYIFIGAIGGIVGINLKK